MTTKPPCIFNGCSKPQSGRQDLCTGHIQQRNSGKELKPLRYRSPAGVARTCEFEGCDNPHDSRGLCSGHNAQRKLGKELKPLRKPVDKTGHCRFPGCDHDAKWGSRGLCKPHYLKDLAGEELKPLAERNDPSARDEHGRKRCSGCGLWLAVTYFFKGSSCKDGLDLSCRDCRRSENLVRNYRITRAQYEEMRIRQGGGCAICGASSNPSGSDLAVDHDHSCCPGARSCGKCVRALLCNACNRGIGYFRDDPDRLQAAADYIKRCSSSAS